MTEKLDRLVRRAKGCILTFLSRNGLCNRRELDSYVLNRLNRRKKKNGDIVHETKGIHILAQTIAYKELEVEQHIKIKRAPDCPFPMTDGESLFELDKT